MSRIIMRTEQNPPTQKNKKEKLKQPKHTPTHTQQPGRKRLRENNHLSLPNLHSKNAL